MQRFSEIRPLVECLAEQSQLAFQVTIVKSIVFFDSQQTVYNFVFYYSFSICCDLMTSNETIFHLLSLQDLANKKTIDELRPEVVSQNSKADPPQCLSLAWSTDGQTLFAGYSDNKIRVWQVSVASQR